MVINARVESVMDKPSFKNGIVHDRMPLILEEEQLADWFYNEKMSMILHQTPVMLKRQAEYEQQCLVL